MLLGALPPVANAKDDGYVLYSEDGVEMKKMKREFFTADVEKTGCDYWKEGTGEDLQNTGGKLATYRGPETGIDADVSKLCYIDDDETRPNTTTQDYINSSLIRPQKENYIIYNAAEAKKYKHYGDFWVCFKLREGEQEVNSNYFVCGDRSVVDLNYFNDPSQTRAWVDSVGKVNGYPVSVMPFPGTPVFMRTDYMAQVAHRFPYDPIYHTDTGGTLTRKYDTFTHLFKEHFPAYKTAVSSYNRQMCFGFHGIKTEGTIYQASMVYSTGSGFIYLSTPPITTSNMWEYQYGDPEIKRIIDLYYFMDEPRDPEPWPLNHTWSGLYNYSNNNPDGVLHCLWKLGVGNTILEAPTLIEPKFYHILPIANNNDRKDQDNFRKTLTAPRGALRSIPVIGVESYTTPVYDGVKDMHYLGGTSERYFYLDMERYYSAGSDWYQSKGRYSFRDGDGNASFNVVSAEPYYYVNDFLSEFIHNNLFAMSRKGYEIRLCKRTSRILGMNVGTKYLMTNRETHEPINDVSELEYDSICLDRWYGSGTTLEYDAPDNTGGGSWDTDTSYWNIEKYGDGNLTIEKVRVDTSLIDYDSWPYTDHMDYVKVGGRGFRFRNQFTATDDYIFDTNRTLNVIRNIPNPETGAAYDEYSLRTLWKMNINIDGVTRYSIDTTFPSTRPQVMKLDFNPNASTNYGFGNEFSIDTTNNKVSRLSVRVDSNKVRRAGTRDIRGDCLIMMDNTGAYQSIRLTGSGTWASQGNTSAKFRPENIYYCTRNVEAGAIIDNEANTYVSPIFSSRKNINYSYVCGWSDPRVYYDGKPLYLVGTIDSEGWFSVVSNLWNPSANRNGYTTQDLPSSEDGLYYIYLGHFTYNDVAYTSVFELEEFNPIYYYKDGKIKQYHAGYEGKYFGLCSVYPDGTTRRDLKNDDNTVYIELDEMLEATTDVSTGVTTLGTSSSFPIPDTVEYYNQRRQLAVNVPANTQTVAGRFQNIAPAKWYMMNFTVIFKVSNETDFTDGEFECWMASSDNESLPIAPGKSANFPGGYFYNKRSYVPGTNEISLNMRGYWYSVANGVGSTAMPSMIIKHTSSKNVDVTCIANGYLCVDYT